MSQLPVAQAEPVTTRSPWSFVPLLYFLEGLPYVIITGMSVLLFKALALEYPQAGVSDAAITLWTTLIGLPYSLKMLWGPLVDLTLTKRRWVVATQGILLVGFLVFAWAVSLPSFFAVSLFVLLVLAVVSATHDIAADGFYLLSMGKEDQAFFVGVRSTFYRLATIFGSGFLVVVAGQLERLGRGEPATGFALSLQPLYAGLESSIPNPIARAWTLAILLGAGVFGVIWLLNALLMPKPALDRPMGRPLAAPEVAAPPSQPEPVPVEPISGEKVRFTDALAEFLSRAKIGWILMFILTYRFGESMIGKVSPLFLKAPAAEGGLALATDTIGTIQGTWGVLALVVGGILGGMFIARFGFRRSVWPMVAALNIPNLFYIWAAINRPGPETVQWLIVTDQFGYGFGFSAYMVYLMIVARGTRYPTSSYAVATGLMAVGALIAGSVSGALKDMLGYTGFFFAVVLLGIPGIVTLFFIPYEEADMATTGTGEEDLDALLRSRNKMLPLLVLFAAVLLILTMALWPILFPKK